MPWDHLRRSIDRFLDLGRIQVHLAGFYSYTRPCGANDEFLLAAIAQNLRTLVMSPSRRRRQRAVRQARSPFTSAISLRLQTPLFHRMGYRRPFAARQRL